MRLLFVSPTDLARPRGGRAMLARLHQDTLTQLLEDRAASHHLQSSDTGIIARLRGYLDGSTVAGIADVLRALDAHAADAIWLDGSNLGRIAEAVRRHRPGVRILTFFHNVEAIFFRDALRRNPSVRAAGVLAGNYIAERLAIRHSNDVVALSARDGRVLKQLYNRGSDHFLPMAIADQTDARIPIDGTVPADAPLLFVGGSFYANRAGLIWFARRVAPHIPLSVQVVGQGMETLPAGLSSRGNVEIIGAVELLQPHYAGARAAIAPILDGSGMKTKVAEALMFGKRVIGTPEAFSGYAPDVVAANQCCTTVDDFVAAITTSAASPTPRWDPAMRALYERDHSPAAVRAQLAAILQQ